MMHDEQYSDILYKRNLLEVALTCTRLNKPELASSFLQSAEEIDHRIKNFPYHKLCKFTKKSN